MKELRKIGIDFPFLKIQDDNEKSHQLALEDNHSELRNGVNHNDAKIINGNPSLINGVW